MPAPDLTLTELYSHTEQGPDYPARIRIERDQFNHLTVTLRGRGETQPCREQYIRLSPSDAFVMFSLRLDP